MRKLAFLSVAFALVAVSFYGCDEQPSGLATADSEPLASRLGGPGPQSTDVPIDIYCEAGDPLPCDYFDGAFYSLGYRGRLHYESLACMGNTGHGEQERMHGVVRAYACTARTGEVVSPDQCNSRAAHWRLIYEQDEASSSCEESIYFYPADHGPLGFKVRYLSRGDGYRNYTEVVTILPGCAPPHPGSRCE
jgi:hypothetical protein